MGVCSGQKAITLKRHYNINYINAGMPRDWNYKIVEKEVYKGTVLYSLGFTA